MVWFGLVGSGEGFANNESFGPLDQDMFLVGWGYGRA